MPCRLGAGRSLSPRGSLPSLFSRHPRIPPVAGNPFRPAGGLRAVNLRLPRLPPSVAAFASIENHLISLSDMCWFPSRLCDCCGRGCPRPNYWSGMRGFAPHSKTGRWGDLNPLGRIFFGGPPVQRCARLGTRIFGGCDKTAQQCCAFVFAPCSISLHVSLCSTRRNRHGSQLALRH